MTDVKGNLNVKKNLVVDGTSQSSTFTSTVTTGTAPYSSTSTTVNTNLNADLLDGYHASSFISSGAALLLDQTSAQTFTGGTVTGTGLLKVTSGTLGLDTTAYLTNPMTANLNMGNHYITNGQTVSESNFIGDSAGASATFASDSNFIGYGSGTHATNASASNFLGESSGYYATNAYHSVFLGTTAGASSTNGNDAIMIGYLAGQNATNAAWSLFLGNHAGYGDSVDNTISGTSIAIGAYAGTGGYSDSISLGHGVKNSAANQANIGNILYLTGIYASNTQSATPITNGMVQFGSAIYDTAGTPKISIDINNRILKDTTGANILTYTTAASPKFDGLATAGFMKTNSSGVVSIDTNSYAVANSPITAGTNTKITYDTKGLVTSGTSATTSDIIISGGIGSPTYSTVADWYNDTRSSGRITGGTISSHGDGTVDITQMEGMIAQTNSITGPIVFFKKAASNITGITDQLVNWLYISYDSGNLTYHATTDRSTINEYDMFTVGHVYRNGTTVEVMQSGHNIYNKDRRQHDRLILKYGCMDYVSGAILSQPSSLYVAMTAGSWYVGNYPYTTPAVDTTGAGRIYTFYRSGASTWTKSSGLQTLPVTQYNRLSDNTLQTIATNDYGVYWIYNDPIGDLYAVYGQANYAKLADAQASTPPSSVPPEMTNWARLIGRIIFLKSASSFAQVDSAFNQSFILSNTQNHNDLSGLQGGTAGQYYHLTSAQSTNLTNLAGLTYASTSFVKMTAANTYALDTNTYLTAEADTLGTVTGRGATTTTLSSFQNAGGIELGKTDSPNTAGSLKLYSAGTNSYYNTFTSGTNTANATYTLPTAMPGSAGFLKSSSSGTLSWDTNTYLSLIGSSNTQVLFNDSSEVAGSAELLWDKTNKYLKLYSDSARLYFGAGNDAYIQYDGTNMIINPKAVGTGTLFFGGSIASNESGVTAEGTYATSLGSVSGDSGGYGTLTASGQGSIVVGSAEGPNNTYMGIAATSNGSVAMGNAYATLTAFTYYGGISATNRGSIAMGSAWVEYSGYPVLQSTGNGSIAMGQMHVDDTDSTNYLTSEGNGSIAMGYANGGVGNGQTATLKSSGSGSIAMGYAYHSTLQATGTASVAIGYNVQSTANYAQAFGTSFTNNTASTFQVGFGQADLQVSSKTVTVTGVLIGAMDTMTYAATISLDVTKPNLHKTTTVNATGNATINASAAGTAGTSIKVLIINDGTSGKTITFGTNFSPNGTLVGTTSKAAVVTFVSDGIKWYECCRTTGL